MIKIVGDIELDAVDKEEANKIIEYMKENFDCSDAYFVVQYQKDK